MKILFDQGTPAPLRHALAGHQVSTAFEMGWSALANGALLKAAEAEFDVFMTTDRNLRSQQNLQQYKLAIVVLPTTSWPKIRAHEREIVAALNELRAGTVIELEFD